MNLETFVVLCIPICRTIALPAAETVERYAMSLPAYLQIRKCLFLVVNKIMGSNLLLHSAKKIGKNNQICGHIRRYKRASVG